METIAAPPKSNNHNNNNYSDVKDLDGSSYANTTVVYSQASQQDSSNFHDVCHTKVRILTVSENYMT